MNALRPPSLVFWHTQPRSRVLGFALVAGLVVVAAVRAVSWAVGDDLAYLDPPAALQVRGDHPMAIGSVAELNWALGQHAPAIAMARRAAAANPMNGAGYRVLALVAAAQGQEARAVGLMHQALQRSPGDLTARRWLAEQAQAAGQWRRALPLQDRLLRQAPDEGAAWFEEWTARLQEPAVRSAMQPILAAAPPWREAFLAHYAQKAPASTDVDALLSQLPGLSPAEAAAWLGRLVADGRWAEAHTQWATLGSAGAARPLTAGGLVNGGFETAPGLPPFDWSIRAPAGVQASLSVVDGRPGQALRLQFLGTRSAFNGVQQTVLAAPGLHTVHWAYRLEALTTPRGLRWVAACASTGVELGASPLLAGQAAWRDAHFAFEVPAGCPAVALRLELAARIPAETQAYGTAWFDDIRLDG